MTNSLNISTGFTLANEHFDQLCDSQGSDSQVNSADLSYWTGLCESYDPEWYPLGPNPRLQK